MIVDLDANASLRPSFSLGERLLAEWSRLGNPSAVHRLGQQSRATVERGRYAIRKLLNLSVHDRVVFTSGATEANNLALYCLSKREGRIVSSSIEHPCILEPLKRLSHSGRSLCLVKPTTYGEIVPQSVLEAIDTETSFISIMAANNETGVINDLKGIASQIRSQSESIIIHTDAAQLCGKSFVDFQDLGVDLLTLSGHKMGALSGVGALVVREGIEVEPLVLGGPQEEKVRGGTENVLGILSMALVVEELIETLAHRIQTMKTARDYFEERIIADVSGIKINSLECPRLPNTSSIYVEGVRADDLLVALDLEGIMVSTGAACSSGKIDPSHVLLEMGRSETEARSTIRVSFRGDEDRKLVDYVVPIFERAVARMRANEL